MHISRRLHIRANTKYKMLMPLLFCSHSAEKGPYRASDKLSGLVAC